MATFGEAIKSGVNNYANFRGRSTRSEYWFWTLGTGLGAFACVILLMISAFATFASVQPHRTPNLTAVFIFGGIYVLYALAIFLPNLTVLVRRIRDTGYSGWWISLIPLSYVLSIVTLVLRFFLLTSTSMTSNDPQPDVLIGLLFILLLQLLNFTVGVGIFVFTVLPSRTTPHNRYAMELGRPADY